MYSGSPSLSAVVSTTMMAALPLSYIAASFERKVALPSTGISRCRVTACVPWTSSAGLNVPIARNTEPAPAPHPITTGNVGSTRCGTPSVFSVVKASSSVPGTDPDGVQQGILAVPRDVDRFTLGTNCVWIERHRRRLRTAHASRPTGA